MGADCPFVPENSGSWRHDLVGLPFSEAEQILAARGLTYQTAITAPPRFPVGSGELRVVAERSRPEGLLLVLAYREYKRATETHERFEP